MEDDEEIMSQQSGGSRSGSGSGSPPSKSPPPPRPNGRVTVTVAASPPSQNCLTLALPVEQPRSGGNNNSGGGREDCWSEGATGVLIDAWGERYVELSRGNLKQKHWKEVADIVSSRDDYMKTPKTDIQCKNRIDTVKKKYKTEKQKVAAGYGPSRWPFFQRLDELIGDTAKINSLVTGRLGPSISPVTIGFSSSKNVPMGIPVGVRPMSIPQFRQQPVNFQSQLKPVLYPHSNPNLKPQYKRKAPAEDTDSDGSEPEPDFSRGSSDGFPPESKRQRNGKELMNASGDRGGMNKKNGNRGGNGKERSWGNSVREVTRAILKFGEAYEQAESSKLQLLVEMEKRRMNFVKELEMQRMQFFAKTQMEVLELKKHSRVENNSNNHHNHNISNNNNSDSSS